MQLNVSEVDNGVFGSNQVKENETGFLYLRADRRNIKLNYADILFIESLKNYIKVVTKDKTIVTKYPIPLLEDDLPHHSYSFIGHL